MTTPTASLYSPGRLPVPDLDDDANVPEDLMALAVALDPMVELRFSTVAEREQYYPATLAPLGARCLATITGRRYICWGNATGHAWYELREGALVVPTAGDRDGLVPKAPGLRVFNSAVESYDVWDPATATWLIYDTKGQNYDMAVSVAAAAPFPEIGYGGAIRSGRYFRRGRRLELGGLFQIAAGTAYAGLNGPVRIDYPAGLRPVDAYFAGGGISRAEGSASVAHPGGNANGAVLHEWNVTEANRRMLFTYPTNAAALSGGGSATWNITNANNYVQFTTAYEIA